MEWVADFYSRQDEWSGCYTGLPGPGDHERAQIVTAALFGQRGRVLELGAGGGQSALATAQLGHDVTAIELVARTAAHARTLVSHAAPGTLHIVEASFYTLVLPETFDIICYWDGFGVGTDAQQRTLLRNIANWLTPSGSVLIDINTPCIGPGPLAVKCLPQPLSVSTTLIPMAVACLIIGGQQDTQPNR